MEGLALAGMMRGMLAALKVRKARAEEAVLQQAREVDGWQYVFYAGFGPNPNCKHDAEYEFRRGEDGWIGRLADQHPAFNIAGGLMFRPLPSNTVIDA